MTTKEIKRICNLPENVIPTKDIMIDFILHWKCDVGGGKVIQTNGIRDIHSHFEIAKDYYQQLHSTPKGKAIMLDVSNIDLDKYNE